MSNEMYLTENEKVAEEVIKDISEEAFELKQTLERKIDTIKVMTAIQGENGNWNCNPYMHGLYNGMEYCLAILEEREAKFRDAPEVWLDDIDTSKPETKGE